MILTEEEIAQDLFLTTTNKDYCEKKVKRTKPILPQQEFRDPIAASFELYLKIDPDEDELQKHFEDADKYLLKAKKRYKKIGERYLKEPLNHLAIRGEKILEGNTVYRIDYCNVEEEVKRKLLEHGKKKTGLPEGWDIPETTTGRDFRNPTLFDKTCFSRPPLLIVPRNCLGRNETMNKILKIKTGSTLYEDTHGRFGEIVIRKKLFGKMDRPQVREPEQNNLTVLLRSNYKLNEMRVS